MILTKSAVFKELNISLKRYELLKKDTDTGPLTFIEPQNEYAVFSLMFHMLLFLFSACSAFALLPPRSFCRRGRSG